MTEIEILSVQSFAAMHTLEGYPMWNQVALSPWEGEAHLSSLKESVVGMVRTVSYAKEVVKEQARPEGLGLVTLHP